MGDLREYSRPPIAGDASHDRLFAPPSPNPDSASVGAENWAVAEETAQEVVCCVHPTLDSEEKRKDVIEYIQRLIRTNIGCEVFPYGSVPLKTYLPDGDIDLTALSSPTAESNMALDVLAVLQAEEHNPHAEYEVKDTQFIDAEVKLVKCLVQNIVIDLSFNQLGGICTLCFLEQVDRLVGKNHLFKRSIILTKTWCYYESRILGAHHGLISTYAMETLVLYIFHLFHRSLDGPLAVLYKFLDYFSKFDWENYCISLKGPVSKSCLPDIVVDTTHRMHNDYMLSEEFLRNCIDMFSVPSREADTNPRAFAPKHLNIIDPLKESNNLGRSVNRGNFYRIRSAFRYGARKLGRILMLPRENIGNELKRFFANTLERHGQNGRNLTPSPRSFSEEKIQFKSLSLDSESNLLGGDFKVYSYSTEINIPMTSKMGQTRGEIGDSLSLMADEETLRLFNYHFNCSPSAQYLTDTVSQCYTPCYNFSEPFVENGQFDNWILEEKPANSVHEKAEFDLVFGEHSDNPLLPCCADFCCGNSFERTSSFGSGLVSLDGLMSEDFGLDFRERDLVDVAGSLENSNPLSDLSGDYDSHIRSLLYGQCCHGYALSAPMMPNPPPTFSSQFDSRRHWSTALQPISMKLNPLVNLMEHGANLGWTPNPRSIPAQSNSALCIEEKHRPRGTGTYFPVNGCLCKERPSQGRGRYRAPVNHRHYQRTPRSSGLASVVPEEKSSEEGFNRERFPKAPPLSIYNETTDSTQQSTISKTSNFVFNLKKLEFGSLGNLSDDSSLQASDAASGWGSTPSPVEVQNSEALFGTNRERAEKQPYCLKDEDFPPLTV